MILNIDPIKVIAFDADDTLWDNEIYFREVEDKFATLLEDYLPPHTTIKELIKVEIANLHLYGYGIKGFMLSLLETAMHITEHRISSRDLHDIIDLGKDMLSKPVTLLPGVEETLSALQGKYRLVVATKGDLLDQERKLKKSHLESYFHHIEIMSEKALLDYQKLIKHLDINAQQFFMVGNSLKSDVLPILKLGGSAAHIPYHTTWELERVEGKIDHPQFVSLDKISDLLNIFL